MVYFGLRQPKERIETVLEAEIRNTVLETGVSGELVLHSYQNQI